MKVGILTYHHTTNFGSLLQTFALATKVEDLGYEYEVIDYRNEAVENRESPKQLLQCKSIREVRDYFKYEGKKRKKADEFRLFTSHYINVSAECYNKNNIENANLKYDTFLVGSDLVWDFTINDSDTTYMLDFADESKRKCAYASSTGQIWEHNDLVQELLDRFQYIGVRENEIKKYINNNLDIKADFVGDPTVLINPQEWDKMAADRMIDGKYVLVYFSDKNMQIYKDAVSYGEERNIPVYLISYGWVPKTMKAIRPTKIEEFLSLIKYADAVFSASYHGMLFSIYFNKNFYYYNRGWKSRMQSIAEFLQLTDREHYIGTNSNEIDYNPINIKMEEFRSQSIGLLSEYLAK